METIATNDHMELTMINEGDTELLIRHKKELTHLIKQREAAKKLGHDTTKLSRKIRGYARSIRNLIKINPAMSRLKERSYYIVDIEAGESIAYHRAVMATGTDIAYGVTIFNRTYGQESSTYTLSFSEITSLKIISELTEMNK